MHDPPEHHIRVFKRILHYLVGIVNNGLILCIARALHIFCFRDSNWGTDLDDWNNYNRLLHISW